MYSMQGQDSLVGQFGSVIEGVHCFRISPSVLMATMTAVPLIKTSTSIVEHFHPTACQRDFGRFTERVLTHEFALLNIDDLNRITKVVGDVDGFAVRGNRHTHRTPTNLKTPKSILVSQQRAVDEIARSARTFKGEVP